MTPKLIAIAIAFVVFGVMLVVTVCTTRALKAERKENESLRLDMARLRARLDNAQTMLELKSKSERDANEKKRNLAGGNGRNKFDNAVGVMRD